ncbi:hypothetical protein HZS_533 [Henneguya salminicola]|nr:hypothetical protein HZS_533 [Henneguya salminicola]
MNPKHSCGSRSIISDNVREAARKIEKKALELAPHRCLTAGTIHRPLLMQAFVSNEEFYRVHGRKK